MFLLYLAECSETVVETKKNVDRKHQTEGARRSYQQEYMYSWKSIHVYFLFFKRGASKNRKNIYTVLYNCILQSVLLGERRPLQPRGVVHM